MDKLVEHHGVLLSESMIRRIAEGHARQMAAAREWQTNWPRKAGSDVVVAQTDGAMVPIVGPDSAQVDRRKGKRLQSKEARIRLAYALGSMTRTHGGTLQGDVDWAGRALFE